MEYGHRPVRDKKDKMNFAKELEDFTRLLNFIGHTKVISCSNYSCRFINKDGLGCEMKTITLDEKGKCECFIEKDPNTIPKGFLSNEDLRNANT